MLDVNIDRSAGPPLHEQVAAQIRRAIADGDAGPGERLPLAKDLAAVLGVNKNTVLRALHLLREEGLLDFRRGSYSRGLIACWCASVLCARRLAWAWCRRRLAGDAPGRVVDQLAGMVIIASCAR